MSELESITPHTLRSRIKGEFYKNLQFYKTSIKINEEGKINLIIEKKDINNKIVSYKFIIPDNYPYLPPTVFINNKLYGQYLRCPNKFLNILKYIKGVECFCCSTCTCRGNWSPACTLKHIIDEIEENSRTKYNIMIKIFLEKIKEQYLNQDIELDSWLFNVSCPNIIKPGTQYYIN